MFRNSIVLFLLIALLALAACGIGTSDDTEKAPDTEEAPAGEIEEDEASEPDANEEEEEVIEDDTEEESNEETDSEGPSENKVTETGIYNGQADPHTIEIETDEGPTAFQLTMEARDDIEQLTEGGEVTYTYFEDGEQLVIESINPN